MKHQWLAYVIVGLLSVGAGVAIAGLPDNTSVDATIVAPTTTAATPPTSENATDESTVPESTEPATTEPSTTVTTSTTIPPTTSTSTTVPADDLPPRSEVAVIVANGANISGAAGRNVDLLRELGYTDIAARNGTNIVELTTVYYADGFEDAAARLADDLELLPELVGPLAEAPEVIDLPEGVQLLAYIGIDRAG